VAQPRPHRDRRTTHEEAVRGRAPGEGAFTQNVSTTGTDSDWVVKLIEVYPADHPDPKPNPAGVKMGGYQHLVRGEVMCGRFRNSFETPEAFVPGQHAVGRFRLLDVNHTFRAGHKIMVQVQIG
jgi:predicted acyl esterase